MTDKPLITIGITCHNAEKTIKKAIESAINQDWSKIEVIVVDDASNDSSVNVVNQITHPIKLIEKKKNEGVAAARNTIVDIAKGEYIAFFDDDDESTKDRISKQYQRLVEYLDKEAITICHTARLQTYPDQTTRYEPTMGCNEGIAPNGLAVLKRILTGQPSPNTFGSCATCSQMAKTEVYRSAQGFDESFRRSEDTEFNIRLAIKGAHFLGISEPLVKQKMTHASDKKIQDEYIHHRKILQKHKKTLNKFHSYNFCDKWLEAKYMYISGNNAAFFKKAICLMLSNPIYTVKKLIWALPNLKFNMKQRAFYNEQNK